MLFRRRTPASTGEKLRIALVPRRSFARSYQYIKKRVLRLNATPHAIAAGIAAGVIASFTPLLGFHFVLAFALAYLLAGNMIAAALGTAVGNPLTFPLIYAATYRTGHWMLGNPLPTPDAAGKVAQPGILSMDWSLIWTPVLKPMLVGAVPLGAVAGLVFYVVVRKAVTAFRHRRALHLVACRARSRLSVGTSAAKPA